MKDLCVRKTMVLLYHPQLWKWWKMCKIWLYYLYQVVSTEWMSSCILWNQNTCVHFSIQWLQLCLYNFLILFVSISVCINYANFRCNGCDAHFDLGLMQTVAYFSWRCPLSNHGTRRHVCRCLEILAARSHIRSRQLQSEPTGPHPSTPWGRPSHTETINKFM